MGKEIYTPELAAKVLERLADTGSLAAVCNELSIGRNTVIRWIDANRDGFADAYARAKDQGIDKLVEDTLTIADDGTNDYMMTAQGVKLDAEHVQRSKLRIETRRWLAERMAPKKYGVLNKMELTGVNGGPVQSQIIITTGVPTDNFEDLA